MDATPPFLDSLERVVLLVDFWGGAVGRPPNKASLLYYQGKP